MIQSSKRRFTLLTLFAMALVTMPSSTTYVHAEDVEVVEDGDVASAAAVESSSNDAIEEVMDAAVVEEEPVVKEAVEDVTVDEKEEEEEVQEAAAPVIVESSKDDVGDEKVEEEETEVKETSEGKQDLSQPAVPFVERSSGLITKVKDAIKSADFDAKKIAAFGLGAWGAATGVGWAMEKVGGKKED